MSIQLITIKCPECGATLSIEDNREQAFCTYCGAKVLIHNENEYIYRQIDEAGVKQAETDRLVRMKQMELLEKKQEEAKKQKALKIKLAIIMAFLGIVMMVVAFLTGPEELFVVGFFPLYGAAYVGQSLKANKKDEN